MKKIILNDVAASTGGALSILRQFLAQLKNNELNGEHIETIKANAKNGESGSGGIY